jgi:hypothetical protein
MKLLILTIIALVIPLFFVFVFVMSTVNKLTILRQRCLDIRERGHTQSVSEAQARSDFNVAMEQYNEVRKRFPGKLLARLWGFREMEPWAGQHAAGFQPAGKGAPSDGRPAN